MVMACKQVETRQLRLELSMRELVRLSKLPSSPLTHLSWADGLAQLAGDAALLAGWVTAKRVLATEPGRERALFERVVDGGGLAEEVAQCEAHA